MDWYANIKRWYQNGTWTIEMVKKSVLMGKITEEQCNEILNSKE